MVSKLRSNLLRGKEKREKEKEKGKGNVNTLKEQK